MIERVLAAASKTTFCEIACKLGDKVCALWPPVRIMAKRSSFQQNRNAMMKAALIPGIAIGMITYQSTLSRLQPRSNPSGSRRVEV